MKATIQIPRGWRRLRVGEKHRKGDMTLSGNRRAWLPVGPFFFGRDINPEHFPIRRIARPCKWVPKGYTQIGVNEFYAEYEKNGDANLMFGELKGRKLMDYTEWMTSQTTTAETMETTRIFLRRNADK